MYLQKLLNNVQLWIMLRGEYFEGKKVVLYIVIIVSIIQYFWVRSTHQTEIQLLYISALIAFNIGLSVLVLLKKQKNGRKYEKRESIGFILSIILVILIPIVFLFSN